MATTAHTTPTPEPTGYTRLLTVQELSDQIGLSVSTIARRRSEGGSLPRALRLGARHIRWRQAEIDAWLEEQLEDGGR